MKLFKQKETYVSDKVRIYGDIETDADISIDGEMHGNIVSKKNVSFGVTARFEGNVECETAIVNGNFIGTLVARRLIEVKVPAVVVGDLISESIRIDSGVAVQGKILAKNISTDCGSEPKSSLGGKRSVPEAEAVE